MSWFFIALIAPLSWSISNFIDKYLIEKYFKGDGIGALIIFSSLIGLFMLPIIYFIEPDAVNIDLKFALLIILNGVLFVFAYLPYMYAMERDETSIVVPLYQMIPVISYFLGLIFLDEVLNMRQISASLFVVIGAVGISLDIKKEKLKLKKEVLLLMLLSSFMFSLNGLIFKVVAINEDFWTTSFWEYVGFSLTATFLLIFIKSYRDQFLYIIKKNKAFILSLNALNEAITIIGKIAMNFATVMVPLAIAWAVNGFHPFFVLIFGVLITVFFPSINRESLDRKSLVQKLIAIVLMCIGAYFLNIE